MCPRFGKRIKCKFCWISCVKSSRMKQLPWSFPYNIIYCVISRSFTFEELSNNFWSWRFNEPMFHLRRCLWRCRKLNGSKLIEKSMIAAYLAWLMFHHQGSRARWLVEPPPNTQKTRKRKKMLHDFNEKERTASEREEFVLVKGCSIIFILFCSGTWKKANFVDGIDRKIWFCWILPFSRFLRSTTCKFFLPARNLNEIFFFLLTLEFHLTIASSCHVVRRKQ